MRDEALPRAGFEPTKVKDLLIISGTPYRLGYRGPPSTRGIRHVRGQLNPTRDVVRFCSLPSHSDEPCTQTSHSDEPCTQTSHSDEPCTQTSHSDEPCTQTSHSDEPCTQTSHSDEPCTQTSHSDESIRQLKDDVCNTGSRVLNLGLTVCDWTPVAKFTRSSLKAKFQRGRL